MRTDQELLQCYAETGSEEAFAEFVGRRLDLVYSAALRQVNGDAGLAREVAQSVFTDLARKAVVLSRRQDLTGWLYTGARFAAAKAVRTERRRQAREREALTMRELLHTPAADPDWERLRPVLDEAMHELKESDREAILIRYFENLQLAEVGRRLGLAEDAARKRVDRAVARLRALLAKRGFPAVVSLFEVMSAHAIEPAPAGWAVAISSASLAGAALGTGTNLAFLKFMAATKLKTTLLNALLVAVVLTPFWLQQRSLAGLRQENLSLGRKAAELALLPAANARLTALLGTVRPPHALAEDQFNELLRMRGRTGALRTELEKSRAELASRSGAILPHPLLGRASTNFYAKSSWASAGHGTPEATVQSLAWAVDRSDMAGLAACLSPQAQASLSKHFEGKSDAEIAAELSGEAGQFANVQGLRIVNEKTLPDGEVFLTIYQEGTDSWASMRLKQNGNQWQIADFPQSP